MIQNDLSVKIKTLVNNTINADLVIASIEKQLYPIKDASDTIIQKVCQKWIDKFWTNLDNNDFFIKLHPENFWDARTVYRQELPTVQTLTAQVIAKRNSK